VACQVPFGYRVDLHRALGLVTSPGIAYAVCYIINPLSRPAKFHVGSDDGHKLWVNHAFVGEQRIERGLGIDQDTYSIQLQAGVNVILLKVEHVSGAFEFCCRLTDIDGKSLDDVKVSNVHPDHPQIKNSSSNRLLTDNDLFSHLMETQKPQLSCCSDSADSFFRWHTEFSNVLEQCLGATPPSGSHQAHVVACDDEGDYIRETIHYEIMPGAFASAYLLLPKMKSVESRLPVIVNLPGHGAGKDHVAGVVQKNKEARGEQVLEWEVACASGPLAVRQGYAVFIPEFLAFGDRSSSQSPNRDPCDHAALWALALGYTLPRLNCVAISRGIDYLETRTECDASRLAVMGHSFGGFMSMLSSAIEPRIKATVISGMLGSFAMAKGGAWFCGSQTIPGLLRYGGMMEIAGLIAPRPLLSINGTYDSCAPFIYAEQSHRRLLEVYRTLEHVEKYERFTFPGDHVFQPQPAIDFIEQWIGAIL